MDPKLSISSTPTPFERILRLFDSLPPYIVVRLEPLISLARNGVVALNASYRPGSVPPHLLRVIEAKLSETEDMVRNTLRMLRDTMDTVLRRATDLQAFAETLLEAELELTPLLGRDIFRTLAETCPGTSMADLSSVLLDEVRAAVAETEYTLRHDGCLPDLQQTNVRFSVLEARVAARAEFIGVLMRICASGGFAALVKSYILMHAAVAVAANSF